MLQIILPWEKLLEGIGWVYLPSSALGVRKKKKGYFRKKKLKQRKFKTGGKGEEKKKKRGKQWLEENIKLNKK